ncbi:MAG: hypothetical protein HY644_03400 [Acidobacteria bacterium]|nr:hypothetical protein [Acidobacteriota bacterium]
MKILYDYAGLSVRLSDERLAHILEHPEMTGMEHAIEETLRDPEQVVESFSDREARLYYRFYSTTRVGKKYVCVVVKTKDVDYFVLTVYLTDKIKKGVPLWPKRS